MFVQINLNTASDAEILLVPGAADRMPAEFQAYRPCRTLPQFRREIGKSVEATELARLHRPPANLRDVSAYVIGALATGTR